jgi:hypothetical protein
MYPFICPNLADQIRIMIWSNPAAFSIVRTRDFVSLLDWCFRFVVKFSLLKFEIGLPNPTIRS